MHLSRGPVILTVYIVGQVQRSGIAMRQQSFSSVLKSRHVKYPLTFFFIPTLVFSTRSPCLTHTTIEELWETVKL